MFQPVQKKSLADNVFEQLRDRILAGELPAGEALPSERELCQLLGVNRGALREALKRLQESRLVQVQHGGATRVLDFTRHAHLGLLESVLFAPDGTLRVEVARSVLEMRTALAPDIARLAAARRTPAVLASLEQTLARMAALGEDLPGLQLAALDFWDALVDGADNVAYRFAFNSLREGYQRFIGLLGPVMREEVTHHEGYAALTGAVRAQRPPQAAALASALMARSGDRVASLLSQLGAGRAGRQGRLR